MIKSSLTAARKIAQSERAIHGLGPISCVYRIDQIVKMDLEAIQELYDEKVGDGKLGDRFYPVTEHHNSISFVDHSYDECGGY